MSTYQMDSIFTLGTSTEVNDPSGILGANLWLKGNDGVLNTGDGSNVTGWEGRSSNNYSLSDVGASPYVYRATGN